MSEFGVASSNKGGRRELDEQTFGTHVPPQKMGYVFKMSASEMSAKSQRGATGPLTQATGPPRSGGGVAIGMLRGNPVLSAN